MNAAVREEHEVPVVSNETLEVHIVSLRLGLDEVKEDVRELRADTKSLREKLDAVHTTLRDKIDESHATLSAKIDSFNTALNSKCDSINASLGAKIAKLSDDVADLRSLHKAMLWVIGGVGSLATILMTIGKTLHWF